MIASCSCGRVELEVSGTPITSVVCYCNDCQEAAQRIEALTNACPVREPDGGTAYVVYRKDRVYASIGVALLKSHKLTDKSATKRVVATCCNSAMFLGFDDQKHWVDVYRARLRGALPPLRMRICTRFKPKNGELPDDVPSYPRYPFKFIAKLLVARIAMRLGR